MASDTVNGVTTPMLLPARRWEWRHVDGPFALDVSLHSPIAAKEGGGLKDVVSFECASDIDVWFDFGTLIKTMFTEESYPKLEDTQVFVISSIVVNKKREIVTVVGNVLEKVI